MLQQRSFSSVFLFAALMSACLLVFPGCPSGNTGSGTKETAKAKTSLSPEAAQHVAQGQKFLFSQKIDEAVKEFQEAVRLASDSPPAHYWLGRAYFFRKDKDQAEKSFKKVLDLEPDNYHAMAMLGKMYSFDKDKLDQAKTYLQKALETSPENLEAHFDLGRIYAMQGERNKALQEFGFLFSKERDFFMYHFELGRMLEAWGEKDKAIEQYKRAQLLNPNFTAAGDAVKRLAEGSGGAAAPSSPAKAPPKR